MTLTFSRTMANLMSEHTSAYRMAEECSLGSAMQWSGHCTLTPLNRSQRPAANSLVAAGRGGALLRGAASVHLVKLCGRRARPRRLSLAAVAKVVGYGSLS